MRSRIAFSISMFAAFLLCAAWPAAASPGSSGARVSSFAYDLSPLSDPTGEGADDRFQGSQQCAGRISILADFGETPAGCGRAPACREPFVSLSMQDYGDYGSERAFKWRSPTLSWFLAFLMPGVGHFYVGGKQASTYGGIHLVIHVISSLGLVFSTSPEAMGLFAVIYVLNWVINQVDVVILCNEKNSYYKASVVSGYEPESHTVSLGWGFAF